MPRKGINLCPKCGAGGCAFGDPATLLVACRKCGHTWKTRSREAKQRARRMLSNADKSAGSDTVRAEVRLPRRVLAAFDPCCGHPPIVTEWRPGCYGAECATCGRILGAGRQVRENDLMAEWNNEQRKERT